MNIYQVLLFSYDYRHKMSSKGYKIAGKCHVYKKYGVSTLDVNESIIHPP